MERALRTSGAPAVPVRAVVLEAAAAAVVVEDVGLGARGTEGFFSGTVLEDGVVGLVAVVRVREAAVVEAVSRLVVVVVLGLVGSAVEVFRVLGFFSSPGLPSTFEARGFLAAAVVAVRVDAVVRVVVVVLVAVPAAVEFLVAAAAVPV